MKGLLFKGAKGRVFAFMAAIALSFSLIGVVPVKTKSVNAAEGWTNKNLIVNGDFESDLRTGWTVPDATNWDAFTNTWTSSTQGFTNNTSQVFHWYSENGGEYTIYQSVTIEEAGTYKITFDADGKNTDYDLWFKPENGNNTQVHSDIDSDWDVWASKGSGSVDLEAGNVTIQITLTVGAKGWGDMDNVKLWKFDGYSYTATPKSNTHQKGTENGATITVDSATENIASVTVSNDADYTGTKYTMPDSDEQAVITFSAAYLDTLSVGSHTVTIGFSDGAQDVESTLTISDKADHTATVSNSPYTKYDSTNAVSVTLENCKTTAISGVYLDNATDAIAATNYETSASDESAVITFKKDYLNGLTAGEHTAKVTFTDGADAKTGDFTVSVLPTGLQNGGFENGIGGYWNGGFAVSENDNNNNGKYLNLWVSNNGEASLVQNFKAESTGTFDISYKVIGDGNAGIAFWVNDEKIGEIEGGSYSWPEVTTTKSFDLKKDDIVKFEIKGTYSGTWAAIDDVQIVEHKDVQEELPVGLQNGDFEKSDYWVLPKDGPFDITYTNGKENENGGKNGTKYVAYWTNDLTKEYEATQTFKAEDDGEYIISYDYLGEGEVGLAMYIDGIAVESLEGDGGNEGNWTSKTTKTKFSLTKDKKVTFSIKGTTKNDKAYIKLDNIKIEKYVPKDREFYDDTTIATGAPVDTEELYVEKLDLANGFITGADISSYASIVASGATYKDAKGKVLSDEGFFKLLKESGVNYVRIRVWVDPKDANKNYYGGGNCDLATAKKLGKLATDAGMRVLVDFHYSDFWTDPSKQQAPKAWKNLSLTDKAATLKRWTIDSLTSLIEAGVDVGMVQIGNETTNGFCGENKMENMCTLFKAGSEGVQAVETAKNTKIMMAIHLTNPEKKGNFASVAAELKKYGVVYDVFATSFYPYWHGTLDNLYTQLNAVATNYDKYVMVAETSYVRTLEDGDGWANTESQSSYDSGKDEFPYDISEQGQVLHVRNVIKTVSSIKGGIGVFWWEPAWIPVENWADAEDQDSVLASNQAKWEKCGSGWAASYAAEYDPDDAGKWYGGSAVDNESWFDFDGTALESLQVYNMVRFGTTTEDYTIESIDAEYAFVEGEDYDLPAQIEVLMASGKTSEADVTWNMDQVKEAVKQGRGSYQIDGTYTYNGIEYEDMAILNLIIKPVNLVTNGSFEDGETGWDIERTNDGDKVTGDDPHDGSNSFHFWSDNEDGEDFEVTQTLTLEPGAYAFNGFLQGLAGVEGELFVIAGDDEYVAAYTLDGWRIWQNPTIERIIITEETEITVGFRTSYSTNEGGTIDDLTFYKVGDIFTVTFDNNGHGTAPEALIVVEGETIDEADKLVADKKDQVEFTGWYTDKECKNKFDFDTKITKDITLYAGWKSTTKDDTDNANKDSFDTSSTGSTWTPGDGDMLFTVHGSIDDKNTINRYKGGYIAKYDKASGKVVGVLIVLNEEISSAVSGSLKLTIFSTFLESLEPGDYLLHIDFADGAVETIFTINAKAADASVKTDDKAATNSDGAPKTGDDTPVSAVMLILLISAAGLSYMLGLKREKRR